MKQFYFTTIKYYQLSFVIVTHNEELAAKADRKVVMKDGRIEGV